MSNLDDMTAFDSDTGMVGVFNGDSFVKGLKHDLSSAVTNRFGDDALVNYGIDIDRYGVMSFDSSVLEDKLATDEESVKTFFTGGVDDNGNETTGFFVSLDDKMKSYTGYNGLLDNFDEGLKKDASNLADAKAKAQATIDNRYDIMTQQFIAYDAMISQMNASFSSLQMTIDAATSDKN
jgi:flagellar hook-associated protein 2